MKSRYTGSQDKKNSYIKWGAGGLLALLLIAGTWVYANDWGVEQSSSAPKGQQAEETKAPEKEPDSQDPVVETPEAPPAEEEPPAQEPKEEKPKAEAPKKEEPKKEEPKKEEPKAEEPNQEEPAPEEPQAEEPPAEEAPAEQKPADATIYQDGLKLPAKPTYIKNIILANKQHPLPQNYAPGESKEARAAFEAMQKDGLAAGINLNAFSTYREFARQKQLYEGYAAKDGAQAADRYSARPGYSEHQTGLAFDIGEAGQEQHWASASFGATKGGKWLKANAHKYGFILRYPEGAEKVTGYMHESWHFRFVGKAAAKEIFAKDITLEQYLGVQ